ncbi:hypothetical protein PHJA_000246700 [Phtheirospermum japonicum]|uniref:Late embryogenesis abundant protein LEA-2 subgroup domain-containing protein n=1 Tax=Phtheirospermum japonicum TaxID=374723 RepID=A0A830B8K3_9LAMI|nr:hypothetical protein PHJA_000246700 [Phtheirospermum japonicum]
MAEKEQQSPYPMAPAAILGAAGSGAAAGELRRKKRNRLIMYIVLFAIFQTGIILVFSFTVMKVRTPKFRVRAAALTNVSAGTPASPSFSATMSAELGVRNNNFGRYKYRNTTVEFLYGGASAGRAIVRSSRANWRSTRKLEVVVDLSLTASPELASDLSAGVLRLSSSAKMRGRVELILVMRKSVSTAMNCSMEFVLATHQIRNIVCN